MRLYVLSDLHILGPDDPIYRSLILLMRDTLIRSDVLILAGDIFDVFVGRKRIFLERYREFMVELESATARGIKIHYIEGNHDFLMTSAFRELPKVKVHAKSVALEMWGKRFYFAHGDTVDRTDYGYRILRGFFRSPISKVAVAIVPGPLVDQIGKKSSARSSCHSRELSSERRQELRKIYRNFAAERLKEGFDFVVLGHCHDLDEMSFSIAGRPGQYINVGFPREHGSMLAWTPGEATIGRQKIPDPS